MAVARSWRRAARASIAAACLVVSLGIPTAALAEPPTTVPGRAVGHDRAVGHEQGSRAHARGGHATSRARAVATTLGKAHQRGQGAGRGKPLQAAKDARPPKASRGARAGAEAAGRSRPGRGPAVSRGDGGRGPVDDVLDGVGRIVDETEDAVGEVIDGVVGTPDAPPLDEVVPPKPPPVRAEPPSTDPSGPPPATAPSTAPAGTVVDRPAAATPPSPSTPAASTPAAPAPAASPAAAISTASRPRLDAAAWLAGLQDRLDDLLTPVRREIDRLAPLIPDPRTRPVATVVPVLLALLGAFLALQRGIGQGLGHVPMVAAGTARTHRRARV